MGACLPTIRPLFIGFSPESVINSIRSALSLRSSFHSSGGPASPEESQHASAKSDACSPSPFATIGAGGKGETDGCDSPKGFRVVIAANGAEKEQQQQRAGASVVRLSAAVPPPPLTPSSRAPGVGSLPTTESVELDEHPVFGDGEMNGAGGSVVVHATEGRLTRAKKGLGVRGDGEQCV